MKSWIFLLSQFTTEALLTESFLIFFFSALYAAFWIFKKRKWGVLGQVQVQTQPVKNYLEHVIGQTEELKAQLFGFSTSTARPAPSGPRLLDPSLVLSTDAPERVLQLEAQLMEKTQALDQALADKLALEARAASGSGSSVVDEGQLKDTQIVNDALQSKLKELESRLNEYSIIEDDLANLKRFQQENAQLKAQLAEKGGSPQPSAPVSAPGAEVTSAPATPPAATPAAAPPTTTPAAISPSEKLGAGASVSDESATPTAASPSSPNPSSGAVGEKELAAEFEKMFKP